MLGNGKFETKPLPIGVSDFSKAVRDYYYIDKTMLIKEILDNRPQVSLFLCPRRFGKTLNKDMLRTYFEAGPEDKAIDESRLKDLLDKEAEEALKQINYS